MAASMNVCPYTVLPNKRLFDTAYYDLAVSKLLAKCWTQLNWLNIETDGGFAHLRQVKNSDSHKRASKLTKDRIESGWMSEIEGVIADIPRKVRGDRCFRLFFEEAGSNPVLKTSWVQGRALVVRGGRKLGTRFAWGTGGDHGPALLGLSSMFYNPERYEVLPFKHSYTASGEEILSGFFFPAYRMHLDYLDARGVTDEVKARELFEINRNRLKDDPKGFMEECSEYCFTPEEALIRQGENQFNQALLAELMANLLIHKTVKLPVKGYLMGGNSTDNGTNPIKWKPDNNGDTWILEEPERGEDGEIIKNLYCAGIDSIDVGTEDSSGQKDVSDFCIVIKKRLHGIKEPKYVAVYKTRPKSIELAYANAIRLMEWYNCKCVLETTRTNIISYARQHNKIHLFMTRPRATISNLKTNTTMIGTPATENIIRHYLEKIETFVNDYSHTIAFEEMLNLLLKYDYENKRKYDIIAAMGRRTCPVKW